MKDMRKDVRLIYTHERYETRCEVNLYTWKIWDKKYGWSIHMKDTRKDVRLIYTHERYETRCAVNLYTWKIWQDARLIYKHEW